MRTSCLAAATLLYTTSLSFSANIFLSVDTINSFLTGNPMPIRDQGGLAELDNGSTADGDGDLLAIGTTDDTTATTLTGPASGWPAPAWNTFFALSGLGSNNHTVSGDPTLATTMGDGAGAAAGLFSIGIDLNDDDHPDIPPSGQLLVIRFYNGPTIGSSTHYNTVSARNTNWLSKTTADQPGGASSLDMDNNGPDLVWQGTPYRTDIPNPNFVPEPSTALLGLLGGLFLMRRRR